MDLWQFLRNLALAVVLFLIAASVGYADLPLADRLEEYIAFVLTTDFEYQVWLERAEGTPLLAGLARWVSALSWLGENRAEEAAPAGAGAGDGGSVR